MTRHECRIVVLKLMFSALENEKFDFDITLNELLSETHASDEDVEFIKQLFEGANANKEEIISKISQTLKDYEWSRIYKVDKCLLIMAVAEMQVLKMTPEKIVINETLDMSKEYSTTKSAKFINGILANFVGEK